MGAHVSKPHAAANCEQAAQGPATATTGDTPGGAQPTLAEAKAPSEISELTAAREIVETSQADAALQRLLDGNRRFVDGTPAPKDLVARREDTARNGQHPFATVVACSDSRCCPEIVFDTSLGDLFVVRTAGCAMGPFDLGSVEYAVGHLNTPLVAVVGHTKCGAVTACCNVLATMMHAHAAEHAEGGHSAHGQHAGAMPRGALGEVVKSLMSQVREKHTDGVDAAVQFNARRQCEDMVERSEEIKQLVAEGKVRVAYLNHDIQTGRVEHLGWVL
eukprot:m51a1_g7404 hypothetical protein (275) ;mRNA; r:177700-178570